MNTFATLLRQAAARSLSAPTRVVGIDVGGTSSAVAELAWRPGDDAPPDVRCLSVQQRTPEGVDYRVLVPSTLALQGEGVVVGEGARRLGAQSPELLVGEGQFCDFLRELGVGKTYPKAPPGLRSPTEVTARLLQFLHAAALEGGAAPDRVVLTVPACFEAAQRSDFLAAARHAGLEVLDADLLEGPAAALTDHLHASDDLFAGHGEARNVVVVDVGGTSCEACAFRVTFPGPGALPRAERLGAARADVGVAALDEAVAREVLLAQLLAQNRLAGPALADAATLAAHPALLGLAEALRVGLCRAISHPGDGATHQADRARIIKTEPGTHPVRLAGGRTLDLTAPTLSAAQLDNLLLPLLGEAATPSPPSLLAPLPEALRRAGLTAADVHAVLVVGGGLVPHVRRAVAAFLPGARLAHDAEAAQTATARGAALHGFLLAALGEGVLRPAGLSPAPAAPAAWPVSRTGLSAEQLRAVEAGVGGHQAILGGPGSGKSIILAHRGRWLLDEHQVPSGRLRLFVFGTVLGQYIQSAPEALRLPDACVGTFDGWALNYYRSRVAKKVPCQHGAVDFDAIRRAVWEDVHKRQEKLFDVALIDEAQDLGGQAFDTLRAVAGHLTVSMDRRQRLYGRGAGEQEVLTALGLKRPSVTLLATYRSAPQIVEVAAALIADPAERAEFLAQSKAPGRECGPPVLHVAPSGPEEAGWVAAKVRERQARGERVGVLLPTNALVRHWARLLGQEGVAVEAHVRPGRGARGFARLDFASASPKVLTYFAAKGLTFDVSFLPALTPAAFAGQDVPAADMLFVAATRAARGLYLSACEGDMLPELDALTPLIEKGALAVDTGGAAQVGGQPAGRTDGRGDGQAGAVAKAHGVASPV